MSEKLGKKRILFLKVRHYKDTHTHTHTLSLSSLLFSSLSFSLTIKHAKGWEGACSLAVSWIITNWRGKDRAFTCHFSSFRHSSCYSRETTS